MNLITKDNLRMSSKEISDLTGKRHDHVLRDIRVMLEELGSPQFWGDYKDGLGRSQPMLLLDKEEALCLVSGYNIKMRMAIIKRWNELEAQNSAPQLPDFTNPIEAARAWADAKEEAQQVQAILIENKPKIEFAERYEKSDGEYGFRQACKHLGANENEFREFLISKEIMYYLGGRLVPYSIHTHAGRFKFVVEWETGSKTRSAPKFTPKGMYWIESLWKNRNKPKAKAERQQLLNLIDQLKFGVVQ